MNTFNLSKSLIIVPMLAALGCSDNDPQTITSAVEIDFAAKVNGADFICGETYANVGSGSSDYKVNDFRLFVHNAYIKDAASGVSYPIELTQDGIWQQDDLAMLDFENGCETGTTQTNTSLRGEVTILDNVDTSNTQVCFTVGVPSTMNHQDTTQAASPLNDASMQWNWLAGYKYIRVDGFGDPTGVNTGFNIHLGAQGCTNAANTRTAPPDSACTIPNTFEVCVDGFDVANSRVAVDAGSVLAGNNVTVNTASAGCMSFVGDEDCVELMPRLGLDYTYGSATAPVYQHTSGQLMFTRE